MGSRTPDLLIANETLYQLSYTPTSRGAPGAERDPKIHEVVRSRKGLLFAIQAQRALVFFILLPAMGCNGAAGDV